MTGGVNTDNLISTALYLSSIYNIEHSSMCVTETIILEPKIFLYKKVNSFSKYEYFIKTILDKRMQINNQIKTQHFPTIDRFKE